MDYILGQEFENESVPLYRVHTAPTCWLLKSLRVKIRNQSSIHQDVLERWCAMYLYNTPRSVICVVLKPSPGGSYLDSQARDACVRCPRDTAVTGPARGTFIRTISTDGAHVRDNIHAPTDAQDPPAVSDRAGLPPASSDFHVLRFPRKKSNRSS